MKIHEVFEQKRLSLLREPNVKGIMLTGSMARGTETPFSDLDIIVISNENRVVEEVIDGVPVETHYNTISRVKEDFLNRPSSAYLYAFGKIISDEEGILHDLVGFSKKLLSSYSVSEERRAFLEHKMSALREKLTASINLQDDLKIDYLIHNNFKYIVEYIYLKNSLPPPPQGLTYEIYDSLKIKPCDQWLIKLITLKGVEGGEFVLNFDF